MDARTETSRVRGGRWNRLLYPLIALSACVSAALTAAAPAVPAKAVYRVIQLSADTTVLSADINVKGQVAFTETVEGVSRAKFYDGNSVRDLGTLGGPSASAVALNDFGQVTGSASVNPEGTVSHAYRWSQAAGMVDLSRPGQGNSTGADINNRGQVAGTAVFNLANDSPAHAFFWSPQTGMLDIGTLGGTLSLANAINDAGTVVGLSEGPEGGRNSQRAFRWTKPEGIRPIGTLPSPFTLAADINAAGHIVGATPFPPNGIAHAFLWTPQAGLIDLGSGSGERSTAVRLNDKDVVVGSVIDFPITFHGFVWTRESGLIEIGVESPELFTNANDVNNRGQVVGAFGDRAYIWMRAQGVVDLNTRIPGAPDGLVLLEGIAISDNGSIVVRANTGLVLLVPQAACSRQAPVVGPIKVTGTPRTNVPLSFSATFRDVDLRDTHKATWSWGDGGKDVGTVNEKNGAGSVSGQHAYRAPGIYTARLTVTDSSGKSTTVQRKVVVCGSGAWVAGEGWFMSPPGASSLAPSQSGVATFAFVSEARNVRQAHDKATIHFSAAGLNFRSEQVDSMMIHRGEVKYRGSGTVNGAGGYNFMLTAISEARSGGGKDRVRIRIWHHEPGSRAEVVDYDNMVDSRALGTDGEGTVVGEATFGLPSS